jgi:hypothetical protein
MKATLFTFLLVFPVIAHAFTSAQNPRVTPSRDHTKLLIMFPPANLWRDAKGNPFPEPPPVATLPNGQTVNLRDKFKKPGVYDAATLAPIWQVDWFAQPEDLLLSDDFLHAVRMNIHGLRSNWALVFYDHGNPVQTYDCPQLLRHLRNIRCVPFTSGNWHFVWYDNFHLSNDGTQLELSTVRRQLFLPGHKFDLGYQEHYTFNLVTGAIINQRTTGVWRIATYAAALLAMIVLPLMALRFLWQRSRSSTRLRRGFPVGDPAAPK